MRDLHLSDPAAWLDDPPPSGPPLVSVADIRVGSAVYEKCEGDLEAQDRRRGGVVVRIDQDYDEEFGEPYPVYVTVSVRGGQLRHHVLTPAQVDDEAVDLLDRVQCRQIVRWCASKLARFPGADDLKGAELGALIATLTEALVGPGWSGG